MATYTEELLAITSGQTTAFSYGLTGQEDPNGTVIDVAWTGVPNRNPSTSGDFVAIWQNNGSVPWGVKPQATQSVTNTTPDGDIPFSGLSLAKLPYAAAYSVGSDATNFYNVAAVLPISPGGVVGQLQAITVAVGYVGATSLTIDYTSPIGVDPKVFGHTVVLVRGQTYIPGTSTPFATTSTTDNSNDAATFTGITMTKGQFYTAAYLAGPKPANVAATVTFQVAKA